MGLVGLVVVAVVGVVVGTVLGDLPRPPDAWTYWAGDLGAPWLVLPGLVGMLARRSWRGAAAAGAVLGAAMVAGFYDLPAALLRATGSDAVTTADALVRWTSVYGLGRLGNEPWLLVAAALGALMGALGHAARRGSVVAAVLVVGAALAEPAFHAAASLSVDGLARHPLVGVVGHPLTPENVRLWAAEAAVGAALLALTLTLPRSPRDHERMPRDHESLVRRVATLGR